MSPCIGRLTEMHVIWRPPSCRQCATSYQLERHPIGQSAVERLLLSLIVCTPLLRVYAATPEASYIQHSCVNTSNIHTYVCAPMLPFRFGIALFLQQTLAADIIWAMRTGTLLYFFSLFHCSLNFKSVFDTIIYICCCLLQ